MDVGRSISTTMISRMILNLHEHANAGIMTTPVIQHNVALRSIPDIPMILTEPDFNSQSYSVREFASGNTPLAPIVEEV
jgi:hypothetical protein